MMNIRLCRENELDTNLAIINSGAGMYRGSIPADECHEPYMRRESLRVDIEQVSCSEAPRKTMRSSA